MFIYDAATDFVFPMSQVLTLKLIAIGRNCSIFILVNKFSDIFSIQCPILAYLHPKNSSYTSGKAEKWN